MTKFAIVVLLAQSLVGDVSSFAPLVPQTHVAGTALGAIGGGDVESTPSQPSSDRRKAIGFMTGAVVGIATNALMPPADAMVPGDESSSFLVASNPALQTFKARKRTPGSFIPGKGLRNHENDQLVASNPALQTFKARKRTPGSFIPGKGLRNHEVDQLLAGLDNPALQTFKAKKGGAGSFIPGKGLRQQDESAA